MSRPYLSLGSAQLNKLFLEAGDDLAKLGLIEQELERRTALAALQLLQQVRKKKQRLLAAQAGQAGAYAGGRASGQIHQVPVSGRAGQTGQDAAPEGLASEPAQTAGILGTTAPTIPTLKDVGRKVVARQSALNLELPGFVSAADEPLAEAPLPSLPPSERAEIQIPVFVSTESQPVGAKSGPHSASAQPSPKNTFPAAAPGMALEQAYRVLKVTAASTWEQVEASRRDLVARAQPDKVAKLAPDKRRQLQDEARQVNQAYQRLMQEK